MSIRIDYLIGSAKWAGVGPVGEALETIGQGVPSRETSLEVLSSIRLGNYLSYDLRGCFSLSQHPFLPHV